MDLPIAVDAMGGDNAPEEVIEGAYMAAREAGIQILLVGRVETVEPIISKIGPSPTPGLIGVENAEEVIGAGESPVSSVRKKRDSSLVKGLNLVKEGKAAALVSAGNTGALVAGGYLILGRIEGIERPALPALLPTAGGKRVLLLDVGANTDCKPKHLMDFAMMGSSYVENVLGMAKPTVGLLNIGIEEGKGNELTKEAFALLKSSTIRFQGNVEARDIFMGECPDVVVCDGFVGNVVLKGTEGVASALFAMLKKAASSGLRHRMGALLLRPALKGIVRALDYSEYGGVPVLGLSAPVIKCHGSSGAFAIKNGILQAQAYVKNGVIHQISNSVIQDGGSDCPSD